MSKTSAGLVKWAQAIIDGGKHVYWWGTYCNPCTSNLLKGKTKQYPDQYKESRQATYKKHVSQGKIATDCCGLIKGYYWEKDGAIKYGRNGLPDKGASGMYSAAKIKGKIANGMPEIPGALVWTSNKGHVGVYVGNGYVIEARGFAYGVQKNAMSKRSFVYWGLCPYIEYTAEETAKATAAAGSTSSTTAKPSTSTTTKPSNSTSSTATKTEWEELTMPTVKKGHKGTAVRVLQRMLINAGCKLPKYGADGKCGAETVEAIKAFQTTHALTVDGIAGALTWAALAG